MIVKPMHYIDGLTFEFESSVNSYDSQTCNRNESGGIEFESSVNSYDSQTTVISIKYPCVFESSVNSYDSQTIRIV